ncbi:MAG: GGDEF domain-containing protein, partial [Clostridiales Family XIII bacterium]|nr:GGDEF domain-containing protein [Clostridiales Family XIII bacterium]
MIGELRGFASSLSKGQLDVELPPRGNELASNLKALHAMLRHLTWQTQRVAEGDYNQHISFMGEFAEAFNSMIAQLRDRQENLEREMDIIRQKTQELTRSNALFESITAMMSEWIVIIDRKTGEHLYSNHPIEDNLATPLFEPQLDKTLFEYAQMIDVEVESVAPQKAEFPLLSDFAVQWFELMLYPMEWYGRDAAAAVLTDVTEDRAQLQELENVAYKDMLTGAYNRHFGMKLLSEWLAQGKHFIIAFIDMDRLKYVNDVFGHAEGDRYILNVAEVLSMFSPIAQVCRLGGDEFMLLAKDMTQQGAEARLELLRSGMVAEEHVT